MYLTRHETPGGPRWALDGSFLPPSFTLELLLQLPEGGDRGLPARAAEGRAPRRSPAAGAGRADARGLGGGRHLPAQPRGARGRVGGQGRLHARLRGEAARAVLQGDRLARRRPRHADPRARRQHVERPRAGADAGHQRAGEIVGYTVGNDVSSRDIEGENPLYLPQAKVYDGSCAVGPGIALGDTEKLKDLTIALDITRGGESVFKGDTRTSQIKRPLEELVDYLCLELAFPKGAFLLDRHRHRAAPGLLADPRRRRPHHHRRADAARNEVAGKSAPARQSRRHGARTRSHRRRVAAGRQPVRIVHGDRSVHRQAPAGVVSRCRRSTTSTAAFRAAGRGGRRAARDRRSTTIARFLDDYAARIEAAADALVERAARETGLPETPRLRSVELPRTTNQLRQGAAAARERSWCAATIDTKANLRSCYGPLGGPVVVFGPNNFPFAFNSVAGGDFVAAIAAGNPVIGKANTGHPGTSRLLAELALEAARAAGLPAGMVQLIYRTPPDVGFQLVSHPRVGATGFTGSKNAGLKLKAAADARRQADLPRDVEHQPGVRACRARSTSAAARSPRSCSIRARWAPGSSARGPGLTVVPKRRRTARRSSPSCAALFAAGTPGTLLGPSGATAIAAALNELAAAAARASSPAATPSTAIASRSSRRCCACPATTFLANPHALQTEAFGTREHGRRRRRRRADGRGGRRAGRQPHRLRLQRHDGQGRRRRTRSSRPCCAARSGGC